MMCAALLALAAGGSQAHAADKRLAKALMRIEPNTRLEQVCDMEAMRRIGRIKPYVPDRAKSDVISTPQHVGDAMKAPGAAFRSKGKWYAFSFDCVGTPDHLVVRSFSFQLGAPIPESKWSDLGLWR